MGAHSRAEPSREPRQDGGAWTHPGEAASEAQASGREEEEAASAGAIKEVFKGEGIAQGQL